ncbi:hypothetical protein SARC_11505 [Sphaeroforma arctica JP610]|uniref:Uncharacterized protein n=1 Tax=Sphaeroforma arctica JP610 TaxID=667725 RepID=A0A0L0FGV1_9EUKA|nr:hypothetical protein SARC_11505 [Sphaeroforma arctica JP610]KNC75985.1 hypothetical protein SARC_11505 [Sphaeroforma arctica JP610]|eukprot:XP_014149887.1 hypothetical protein SARC_11505 [Sphaeroforma arctica JP610]
MGILCCRPRRGDDEESQPLLKEGGQHIGNQTLDEDERRGSVFVGSGYDEHSVLLVILERTANELIDINRVTLGSQLCKRDYMERENHYRGLRELQIISQPLVHDITHTYTHTPTPMTLHTHTHTPTHTDTHTR